MLDLGHGGDANGDGEAGYLLLAVVLLVALALIALSVAAPVVAKDLQRDKEVESEHRAEQYVRAIRLYYRKNKSYPPSMDALMNTNNVRYLRQKYVDPLTGKSDWRLIHQPKTVIHIPFGEELGGISAGLGAAGGMASGTGSTAGGTTTVGQTSGLAAGFGGATVASPTAGGTNGSGTPGSTDSGTGMFGDGSGGVIYGVGPNLDGDSILTPNQQTTYETWEFWYDPRIELLYAKGIPTGGGGMGSQGSGGLGSQSASGLGQNGVPGQPGGSTGGGTTTQGTGSANPSGGFGSSNFP
jgi:type II secretory pathway pseudopilin PulG